MTVQQALPMAIWRSAMVRHKVVCVDEENLTGLGKYYRALKGFPDFIQRAVAIAESHTSTVSCFFLLILEYECL